VSTPTSPIEFVLWMNGAAGLIGDAAPTPDQWAKMREKLSEAVGGIVAKKLLEEAEEVSRRRERDSEMLRAKQYEAEMMQKVYAHRASMTTGILRTTPYNYNDDAQEVAATTGITSLTLGSTGSGGSNGF